MDVDCKRGGFHLCELCFLLFVTLFVTQPRLCIGELALKPSQVNITAEFIDHLFVKYGDGTHLKISEFKHLLEESGFEIALLNEPGHAEPGHEGHDHALSEPHAHKRKKRSGDNSRTKRSVPENNECLYADGILEEFEIHADEELSKDDFLGISPVVLTAMNIQASCSIPVNSSHVTKPRYGAVWGFSVASVFVISVAGIVCVAIIPLMQMVLYNHILQFLVALAVGTLCGDAFLHLLPHAILPDVHTNDAHSHDAEPAHTHGIWIGLVALLAIYFFFAMERVMGMVTNAKRISDIKKSKTNRNNLNDVDVKENGKELNAAGKEHPSSPSSPKKRKKNKAEKVLASPDETLEHQENIPVDSDKNGSESDDELKQILDVNTSRNCCNNSLLLMMHGGGKEMVNMAMDNHKSMINDCNMEEVDDIVPQRKNYVDGSSQMEYGHKHSHEMPESVSSLAWMVIMGDGLHNFTDGLAIGAAFTNSIAGGVSTTIAVFCHELPHELGDFAVLIHAGMKLKQAFMYNMVSSVLMLFGMVAGIFLGELDNAQAWIFAFTAGVFIYIALVDMLPEIVSMTPADGEKIFCHFLLQTLGMFLGGLIMLLIALYEENISVSF